MTDKTVKEIAQNKLGLQSYIENLILDFEKANGVTISHVSHASMVRKNQLKLGEVEYKHHEITIEIKI